MKQPRRRPPKQFRTQKSAPGIPTKDHLERNDKQPPKEAVMNSIATTTPNNPLTGYQFTAHAELSGFPDDARVSLTTNWDKENISFPAANLRDVIDALQSLKHELTGKRG